MYTGSKRMSQNGFRSARREVTRVSWGALP
jgi:hypothetical protein